MNGLLSLQTLCHCRLRPSVREHQPIETEIKVSGFVTKVASLTPSISPFFGADCRMIQPYRFSLLIDGDTLLNPIPDEPALDTTGGADGPPIITQTSVGVAHRMAVFAHDEGPTI